MNFDYGDLNILGVLLHYSWLFHGKFCFGLLYKGGFEVLVRNLEF